MDIAILEGDLKVKAEGRAKRGGKGGKYGGMWGCEERGSNLKVGESEVVEVNAFRLPTLQLDHISP